MKQKDYVGIIAYRNPDTNEFMTAHPLPSPSGDELQAHKKLLEETMANLLAVGLAEFISLKTKNKTQKGKKMEEL